MNTLKLSIIFFLALITGCDSSTNYGPANSPVEATLIQDKMEYRLSVQKSIFLLTDTLHGTYTVTNRTGAVKQFFFANMQQWGYRLTDVHGNMPLFYPNLVSPATSTMELQDGESREFVLVFRFKNFNSEYINRRGYTLAAYLLDNNSPAVTVTITVE
jgi:hypothetical protein